MPYALLGYGLTSGPFKPRQRVRVPRRVRDRGATVASTPFKRRDRGSNPRGPTDKKSLPGPDTGTMVERRPWRANGSYKSEARVRSPVVLRRSSPTAEAPASRPGQSRFESEVRHDLRDRVADDQALNLGVRVRAPGGSLGYGDGVSLDPRDPVSNGRFYLE